ncbi:MAG: cell division protein FtsQ/DivIB [Fusobacteriota bacterium]
MLIRTWLKWLITFSILLVSVEYTIRFAGEDYFIIDKVEITGNYEILDNSIKKELISIEGKNIWKIDTEIIENYVKEDIRIKNINIQKIIPNKIKIEIQERESYAYVILDENIYVIDKEGKIFSYANETEEDLVFINVDEKKQMDMVLKILHKINENLKQEISDIYIKNEIIKIIFKNNLLIKTNLNANETKYNIAYNLYERLLSEGKKVEYIDIRFKDYIVK